MALTSSDQGEFDFKLEDTIGVVASVDTATAIVSIIEEESLSKIQVNRLIAIKSSRVGETYIGMVSNIVRKPSGEAALSNPFMQLENDIIKVLIVGTFFEKRGNEVHLFSRSIQSVPTVNAEAYLIEGPKLTTLMRSIAYGSFQKSPLTLGRYSVDEDAVALLDGDKFFQRHAAIVGSTGSGKSWLVAQIVEQLSELSSGDAIVFDIHGEYSSLSSAGIKCMKIAGPNDAVSEDTIFLPYWLLTYDEMLAMMLDRSDVNAPNQASIFSKNVIDGKKYYLNHNEHGSQSSMITINSPVPFDLGSLVESLNNLDQEMIPGSNGKEKQGPYHGKLTRFIQRLQGKITDKRLNFMFSTATQLSEYDYAEQLAVRLMSSEKPGVKVIDFSEVPSDVLPLVASLVARFIFTVQQWTNAEKRHPLALFCDEAHLYMSAETSDGMALSSKMSFERIAKEGRKYGIGLVVVSQRPSEVDKTVLSQCNNFLAMRLTNVDDQNTIKRLLPDNLGDLAASLPILDTGEVIAVGDACLLPSRIIVEKPAQEPLSATLKFWTIWESKVGTSDYAEAIESMQLQGRMSTGPAQL